MGLGVSESPSPSRRRSARASSSTTGAFAFERKSGACSRRLVDLVDADDVLDLDTVAAHLAGRSPLVSGATVWRDIRCTPIQCSTEAALITPSVPRDGRAAALALRAEMEALVERSLEGARRVAVMTGGGVDSSALLGLAMRWAERTGATAFAVALDFDGDGDDRPHLRALQDHLACDVVRVRPEDAVANFDLARRGVDATPFAWPGAPTILETLRVAKREGADRIMVGAGGDFLLDGSPYSLARLVRRGQLGDAVVAARAMTGFSMRPRSPVLDYLVRPLVGAVIPHRLRRARFMRKVSAPDWAGGRLRRFIEEDHRRYVDWAYAPRDDGPARFAAAQRDPEIEASLWDRHQHEVASGLPRVDPYLDPTLARFVASLSPELLVHGATRRGLFREAIRGLVPESLRLRTTKAGFEQCFTRAVLASGGFERLRDLAQASALTDAGLVEPRAFMRAFEELASRPNESWGWSDVWPALMVESFLREHAPKAA